MQPKRLYLENSHSSPLGAHTESEEPCLCESCEVLLLSTMELGLCLKCMIKLFYAVQCRCTLCYELHKV